MSWSLYRWHWQLEASLAIGVPPSGSLNRCRMYVSARNLWAALTARLAQEQATGFPDYAGMGEDVRNAVLLTYLYPAEEIERGWCAWLPRYARGKGLVWQREDDSNGHDALHDREMRKRLLVTRPGTAIDPASDAAAEGMLRETECIGQYWRDVKSDLRRSVGLAGYVFVREGATFTDRLPMIDHLFLGGDTRYGLGRVRRMAWQSATEIFGDAVNLSGPEPSVQTDRVLAHAHAPAGGMMAGQLEALGGWDRAKDGGLERLAGSPLWAPGSTVSNHAVRWRVSKNGLWQVTGG